MQHHLPSQGGYVAFRIPILFLHVGGNTCRGDWYEGVDRKLDVLFLLQHVFSTTVDGSEIPRPTTWDGAKTL